MKCPSCNSDIKITFSSACSLDNFHCRSCNRYSFPERKFIILFYLVFLVVFLGVNGFFHKVLGVSLELPHGTLPFFTIPKEGPATFLILISFCILFLTHFLFFLLFRLVGKIKIREGGHLRNSTIYFIFSIFALFYVIQVFSYFSRNLFK